jgi:CTP synthase (UTP-ammonia lyase)
MTTSIAVVGDRDTSFPTHRAIDQTGLPWMGTDTIDLDGIGGVWLAPGTPYRNEAAVYELIRHARDTGLPFLGTCGGFQYAVVEYARNVARIAAAAHAETDPGAVDPVVAPLRCSLVGEHRLVTTVPGTRLAAICGAAPFRGFHWCNYGVSAGWLDALEGAGMVVSAYADDAGVEGFELPGHPFFMATLFQPQMAGPDHPLIRAFRAAAADYAACTPPPVSSSAVS